MLVQISAGVKNCFAFICVLRFVGNCVGNVGNDVGNSQRPNCLHKSQCLCGFWLLVGNVGNCFFEVIEGNRYIGAKLPCAPRTVPMRADCVGGRSDLKSLPTLPTLPT